MKRRYNEKKNKIIVNNFICIYNYIMQKEKETASTETTAVETKTQYKKEAKVKLSKEQENVLVFGGVLSTRNNMPFNDLMAEEYKDESIQGLAVHGM